MEVTNEMDCSRTESNEGLTHLSISGERERERQIQRGRGETRETYQTEEETERRKKKYDSAKIPVLCIVQ